MDAFSTVRFVASPVRLQSAAEIFRLKVYRRLLVVFVSFLTIVVALALNLSNTAKATEPSRSEASKFTPVAQGSTATPAALSKDFAGPVDIGGGRKIYMECRGSGSPTVVLISGKGNRADIWITPNPEKPGPLVFPEVAQFTRVCAYDRPGTVGALASEPSRSDPVPEPVTIADGVADLHALLTASKEAGPFVLVGHSIGGLIGRLYASTYPKDVSGLVLIDALSEDLYNGLTLEQQAVFEKLNDVPEKYDNVRSFEQVRAAPSVRTMPVIVLTADQPPITAKDIASGRFPSEVTAKFADALWAAQMPAQHNLATLFPDAKRMTNTNSHHYIQNEQPQLVIDSIRQVVDAVRDPTSWHRSKTTTAPSGKKPPPQTAASGSAVSKDFAGLVDIGSGRKMYLECRGTGSPTVVLISGTRGAYDDWTHVIDSTGAGGGTKPSESTVFPQVAKLTRVCAYDRPGTSRNDNTPTNSIPVQQPTTAQQGVADLHALLIAAKEPGPYILVGHSWGGLIARLFASAYPNDVSGLVLIDPASEFLKSSLTPEQWTTYIKATKKLIDPTGLEAPNHERTLDLLHDTPRVRGIPVVVLTSDKRFDFGAGGAETWPAWRTAQDRLAKLLNAKHVSDTNSGHAIQMEQPQLVMDSIREVIHAVRDPASWPGSETITAESGKNPPAGTAASGAAVRKDLARLVDIGGGRKMYLTCHGTGSPTVVLVSGLKASADDWDVAKNSASGVFPEVSKFSRVCSYDRPGTPVGEKPSRSDPVPQPTTAKDAVADLHALLSAAGETGPYVLVGHSYGGLVVKLYARSYPKDVSGLVLVDALSEGLQDAETSEQWPIQRKLMEGDVKESVALYPALERIDPDRSFDQVRAAPPLRSMPLIVLSADHPWGPQVPSMIQAGILPKDVPPDFGYVTDAAQKKAQEQLARLVPNAKHIVKTNSGHEIHKEQPQLVIAAIREVVGAVRREKAQPAYNETDTELPPIDESSRIALEKALDEGFGKSGLPGVIVGLWIPGTGNWIASRGVADLKTKAPMTADLQAPIGSITKSFAVTIALQLVGESKLRLEDKVEQWYPQVPEASAITIKMLLNHSSGFPDISQLQLDLRCANPKRLVTPDELIAMGIKLPRAKFPPGKGSLYSSLNTIVLGRILEKITGESFDALLSERLLKPLALRRTKLDTDGKLDPPFCHGYTDFCHNMPRHTDTSEWPQFSFAAGALASTLSDLHRWGIALGEGFGLTPALRQARIEDEFGIGIQRQRPGGRVISFGHAGSEAGYSANVQYYPCTGAVWALMANGDGGTGEAFFAVLKALQPIIEPLAVPSEKCAP